MKSILISIRPEWVAKILNGEKTIEIRKTAPKCDLPVDVYIYCTKNKLHYSVGALMFNNDDCFKSSVDGTYKYGDSVELMGYSPDYPYDKNNFLNGKVVGKFRLGEIYKYQIEDEHTWKDPSFEETTQKLMGMGLEELHNYVGNKTFYGWHISDLEIFDEPKPLSEFGVSRAPQSWQYVEVEK